MYGAKDYSIFNVILKVLLLNQLNFQSLVNKINLLGHW